MDALANGWFSELSPDQHIETKAVLGSSWAGQAFSLEVEKVIYHKQSKYQEILVFESRSYGKVLALDGVIQCTERDEFAYHETIAHLGLFAHKNPKNILVVGGGDGGVIREIVKHKSVESVTLCEIDEDVITVSKKFLPFISSALSNEKVNIVIGDGLEYLKDIREEYDVIITDSSDPQGPAEGLFSLKFYKLLHQALRLDGVLISQDLELIKKILTNVKLLFSVTKYAISSVPTYTTGAMGYLMCSKDQSNDVTEPITHREDIHKMDLKYYHYDLHRAMFVLPYFIQNMVMDA